MRILQVITRSDAGGAQMVAALLSNELVRKGHEVIMVAGCGDGTLWKWLDNAITCVECENLYRQISPIHDIKTYFQLKRIYNKYKPDIIHLHSSKVGILGRLVFPTSKTVFTVHGFDRVGFGRKLIERAFQHLCSFVVGVCKNDVNNLIEAGVTNNVTFVYNGIPKPSNHKPSYWNIPKQYKRFILCVARLEPQKNHRLYFEVAKLLPDYAFIWIGNASNVIDHPHNVFFLGTLPSASLYCQFCDIFCLPSNYEGLPMTIIEAMSYGKPIISSNVGGVYEIVRDNVNGFTLQNDPVEFASKISYILENKNIYDYMSENSRLIFENELTVEKMTDGYISLYQSVK